MKLYLVEHDEMDYGHSVVGIAATPEQAVNLADSYMENTRKKLAEKYSPSSVTRIIRGVEEDICIHTVTVDELNSGVKYETYKEFRFRSL